MVQKSGRYAQEKFDGLGTEFADSAGNAARFTSPRNSAQGILAAKGPGGGGRVRWYKPGGLLTKQTGAWLTPASIVRQRGAMMCKGLECPAGQSNERSVEVRDRPLCAIATGHRVDQPRRRHRPYGTPALLGQFPSAEALG